MTAEPEQLSSVSEASLAVFDRLRGRILRIPPWQLARWQSGLAGAPPAFRALAQEIGSHFLAGYGEAVVAGDPWDLAARLDRLPRRFRGFAYEGAGLGLAVRDAFGRGGRLAAFVEGPGSSHVYVVFVGAGWALARVPVLGRRGLRGGGLLGWFAFDGYGFHEAFFCRRAILERGKLPRRLPLAARSAFDEGVGRCAWFLHSGDPPALAAAVAGFPAERRADVWSGVGLACGYAGGGEPEVVDRLVALAPELRPALAQGVAFAAEARSLAGDHPPELDRACQCAAGLDVAAMAARVAEAAESLPADEAEAFVAWQRRLRDRFSRER